MPIRKNREFKFRAWMTISEDESALQKMEYFGFGTLLAEIGPDDDCPVMQYIGSKDKNGKDAYEGDVVREWGVTTKSQEEIISIVQWNDYWSRFLFKRISGPDCVASVPAGYEVIGNVYENPELATKKENPCVTN